MSQGKLVEVNSHGPIADIITDAAKTAAQTTGQKVAGAASYSSMLNYAIIAVLTLLSYLMHENSGYIKMLHEQMELREEKVAAERDMLRKEAQLDRKDASEERKANWKEISATRDTLAQALLEIRGARQEAVSIRKLTEQTQKTAELTKKAVESQEP